MVCMQQSKDGIALNKDIILILLFKIIMVDGILLLLIIPMQMSIPIGLPMEMLMEIIVL
jgi:hypothetical protein